MYFICRPSVKYLSMPYVSSFPSARSSSAQMRRVGLSIGGNAFRILRNAPFLNIALFWDEWYPNLHQAFEWPRFQTLHFHGSFWPHTPGFNKLNLEAAIPDAVFEELKARGHDVSRLRAYGMSGCATAVMLDPSTQNRIAGADPRRDCYAIAY